MMRIPPPSLCCFSHFVLKASEDLRPRHVLDHEGLGWDHSFTVIVLGYACVLVLTDTISSSLCLSLIVSLCVVLASPSSCVLSEVLCISHHFCVLVCVLVSPSFCPSLLYFLSFLSFFGCILFYFDGLFHSEHLLGYSCLKNAGN